MYNFLVYSSNYSETTGILWFNSKNKATNFKNHITDTNDFEYVKYKTKLLGGIEGDGADGTLKNTPILVPLKY